MSCPVCQKATAQPYRPFCSKHCANVDLGRWLNGSYAIPAEDQTLGESDEATGDETRDLRH